MVSRQNCGRLHSSVIRPLPVINFSLQGPIEGWGAGDVAPPPPSPRGLLTTGILQDMQICMIDYVVSAVQIISLPRQKPSSSYLFTSPVSDTIP